MVHPVQPGQRPQFAARGAGAQGGEIPGGKVHSGAVLRFRAAVSLVQAAKGPQQLPGVGKPYSVCQYHRLTPLPAPLRPAAGRVVLPQPDRQFCIQGVVLRLLPGVAVGLAQGGIHLRTQQVRV